MKPLNYLIEMFALMTDCLTAVTYTSLNVTAVFLAVVTTLKLLENLTVHFFRTRPFVPSDISKQDAMESEGECISRPLSTEISQCFSNDFKIQHLNDLSEKTGQTNTLPKEACACHNERTSFPTNCFSGSDVWLLESVLCCCYYRYLTKLKLIWMQVQFAAVDEWLQCVKLFSVWKILYIEWKCDWLISCFTWIKCFWQGFVSWSESLKYEGLVTRMPIS